MRGSILKTLALAGVIALSLIVPTLARDVTINGEVAYGGGIVLPAGAELEITLVRFDGRERIPVVDATATLLDRGTSPLIFNFDIHDGVIQPRTRYGLLAEVLVDGKIVLRNRQPLRINPRADAPIVIEVAPARQPR